jgi:hypothetical protein
MGRLFLARYDPKGSADASGRSHRCDSVFACQIPVPYCRHPPPRPKNPGGCPLPTCPAPSDDISRVLVVAVIIRGGGGGGGLGALRQRRTVRRHRHARAQAVAVAQHLHRFQVRRRCRRLLLQRLLGAALALALLRPADVHTRYSTAGLGTLYLSQQRYSSTSEALGTKGLHIHPLQYKSTRRTWRFHSGALR